MKLNYVLSAEGDNSIAYPGQSRSFRVSPWTGLSLNPGDYLGLYTTGAPLGYLYILLSILFLGIWQFQKARGDEHPGITSTRLIIVLLDKLLVPQAKKKD